MAQMGTKLSEAALDCARTAFGEVRVVATTKLRDRRDWWVKRLELVTDVGVRSVIAKAARPRERAALEVLTAANVPAVPRLLAISESTPVVLMEDLGTGPSVADRLLGDDPDEAAAAVVRWAEAVARLQGVTLRLGPAFFDRLAASADVAPATGSGVGGGARSSAGRSKFGLRRRELQRARWKEAVTGPASDRAITGTVDGLRDGLRPLGVDVGDDVGAAVRAELRAIADRLRADPAGGHGPGALTPCDTCPDNNVETPERLVLIDYEGADFRHVAWDAAYLTVPWPTCWCSWRMPEAVREAALIRWRATIEPALAPAVAGALDEAIRDATVAWALITAALFFGAAHRDRPLGHGGELRPRPRELVQHRLGVAAANDPDGVLGRLAAAALDATRAAWGDRPLLLAQAWR
jgi:hypothetical protein